MSATSAREPWHAVKLLAGEPPRVLGFEKRQDALDDLAAEAVHGQVERGVVVLDCGDFLADPDEGRQLFPDFPDERGLRGFARLDFTARKFPLTLEFAVALCGRKDLRFALECAENHRRDNVYRFHGGDAQTRVSRATVSTDAPHSS